MAAYFSFKNNASRKETVVSWHVGKPVPTVNESICITVQADGDELIFIQARFENIPMAKTLVVIWTGEFARFISQNLR